jgi:hypothetical protein
MNQSDQVWHRYKKNTKYKIQKSLDIAQSYGQTIYPIPNKFDGAGTFHTTCTSTFNQSALQLTEAKLCCLLPRFYRTFFIACLQWHPGGKITANYESTCTNIWCYDPLPKQREKKGKNYKSERQACLGISCREWTIQSPLQHKMDRSISI